MARSYYNEFEPSAAAALHGLIEDGWIPAGDIDTRSILDVHPNDLKGYDQCHFFAGIGGWPLAFRMAGIPDDYPAWSGSPPCQPFSVAGKNKGNEDERHLWPVYFSIIKERKPAKVYGEQVESAISHGWLDGVYSDMEGEGYAVGAAVLPACAVDAPHKRNRLWYVADATSAGDSGEIGNIRQAQRRPERDLSRIDVGASSCALADDRSFGRNARRDDHGEDDRTIFGSASQHDRSLVNGQQQGLEGQSWNGRATIGRPVEDGSIAAPGFWSDAEWLMCEFDKKIRRIPSAKSGIQLLAYGVPERVGLVRAAGNAIVPEEAARFILATM